MVKFELSCCYDSAGNLITVEADCRDDVKHCPNCGCMLADHEIEEV